MWELEVLRCGDRRSAIGLGMPKAEAGCLPNAMRAAFDRQPSATGRFSQLVTACNEEDHANATSCRCRPSQDARVSFSTR